VSDPARGVNAGNQIRIAIYEEKSRNYGLGEGFNLVQINRRGVRFMSTRFCWFTAAALAAAAVLPVTVRAQAPVQSSNVSSGSGVSYVRGARPAPPRSAVVGRSFHSAPVRSFNRPTFNAAHVQNGNGAQLPASTRMEPRHTFRPPQRFVPPNLGNRQPTTASGTLNLNLATNRVANDNPAPQTTSNRQFAQTNNSNRVLGNNPRNHVFAQRSANWHPDWDHNHDHWWHGHVCHFVNNTWIIFEIGFYPWWSYGYPYAFGYYPYSYGSDGYSPYGYDPNGYSYGYNLGDYTDGQNGDGYYDNGQYDNQGNTENSSSDQDIVAEIVAAAQDELSLEGYYNGPIDGVFSPETHRAVRDFQRDNGLNVTGYLTPETRKALGLDVK